MSPSDIEVLIWYHCRPEKHPRCSAPAVIAARQQFLKEGMIEKTEEDGVYQTTDKGRAHIVKLCDLPLPTRVCVDAQGRLI